VVHNAYTASTCALPDMYTCTLGPAGPRACVYISGKVLMSVVHVQLTYDTISRWTAAAMKDNFISLHFKKNLHSLHGELCKIVMQMQTQKHFISIGDS